MVAHSIQIVWHTLYLAQAVIGLREKIAYEPNWLLNKFSLDLEM